MVFDLLALDRRFPRDPTENLLWLWATQFSGLLWDCRPHPMSMLKTSTITTAQPSRIQMSTISENEKHFRKVCAGQVIPVSRIPSRGHEAGQAEL